MKHAGLRGLLSLSLREFRVKDGAFLQLSDWLCNEGGTGIAQLMQRCIQSSWLEDSSGTWALKVKLLSSVSAPSPSLAAKGESAPALSACFHGKMRCQF